MPSLRELGARTPLRVQLVAAVVALAALTLVATGAAATAALRGFLQDRLDAQLREIAAPVVDTIELRRRGMPHRMLQLPRGYAVELLAADGTRIASADTVRGPGGGPDPQLPALDVEQVADRAAQAFTVPSSDGGGPRWRVIATPLGDGSGSVVVAASLAEVDVTVRRLRALLVLVGLVVLMLLAGLAWWVVRRSLRPLVEVEHTAAAIAAGDLSRRVPERDARTEVGRLSAALNSMLGQLERAFRTQAASETAARQSEERMRRFVADASHELRTPLTSIRGFAELYRQGAVEPTELARLMRRIEDEAARMGLLVDDLLLLARLDQQRPLERRPVDLLAVATDAVHDAGVTAPDREVRLEVAHGTFPPVVLGDEARLRQVLGNLVGNALTHTPAGTPVTVRLSTRDADRDAPPLAVLEVSDAGPGLAADDARRVFERFYRADDSRTRASGGAGLGLSIVAALTAAHGGRVEVDTAPGAGATFRVLLPAAAAMPAST